MKKKKKTRNNLKIKIVSMIKECMSMPQSIDIEVKEGDQNEDRKNVPIGYCSGCRF